jgi:hypothetical protein
VWNFGLHVLASGSFGWAARGQKRLESFGEKIHVEILLQKNLKGRGGYLQKKKTPFFPATFYCVMECFSATGEKSVETNPNARKTCGNKSMRKPCTRVPLYPCEQKKRGFCF